MRRVSLAVSVRAPVRQFSLQQAGRVSARTWSTALLPERREAMAPADRQREFRCELPARPADRFGRARSEFQWFLVLAGQA